MLDAVIESSFFLLQKLKSTFRSADSPTYRIITQHYPYYEVANGMDLSELRENWDYLVNSDIIYTSAPPSRKSCSIRFGVVSQSYPAYCQLIYLLKDDKHGRVWSHPNYDARQSFGIEMNE
jgi:hypothetical protein